VADVDNYAWAHADADQVRFDTIMTDWSKYDTFTFRLENKIKGTQAIQLILESPPKDTRSDAYSYLRYEIPLDYTGMTHTSYWLKAEMPRFFVQALSRNHSP
jgi:hypothetical protein